MTVHPKVLGSTVGVAAVGILAWASHSFAHVDIPIDVQAEISVVVVFLAGWLTPSPQA